MQYTDVEVPRDEGKQRKRALTGSARDGKRAKSPPPQLGSAGGQSYANDELLY